MLEEFFAAKKAEIEANEKHWQETKEYNDIAYLLWCKVAYNDVLKYKRPKMDEQKELFPIYRWGNKTMMFGPIKALTSAEDREKFIQTAQAELRDEGYASAKVAVYPTGVVVEF